MIVRRAGTDKLPVALITHGANPGNPRGATTDWLRGWAHDLAHRGWLAVAAMRRGYGASEGEVAEDAGTCAIPDVGRYLDAHADDLEAARNAVTETWSNGQTEGQVNKLKTLKRAMYGRAGAELLRARLLPLEVTE